MKKSSYEYYTTLNKLQKAKFNLDLALERNSNKGKNLPDPDGVEYLLAHGTFYQTYEG